MQLEEIDLEEIAQSVEDGFIPKLRYLIKDLKDPKINFEKELELMVQETYFIKTCLNLDYSLGDRELMKCYTDCYMEHKGLLEYATLIDKVDKVLGPLEAVCRYFPQLYVPRLIMIAVEETIKLPFMVKYLTKVNSKESFLDLIGFGIIETFATVFPYADIVDMYNLYKNSVKKYIRNEASKKFTDMMVAKKK